MSSRKKMARREEPELKSKYRQLSDALKTRMAVQEFKPGDKFLSVREIAKRYDVSMLTSHRSVQDLVSQNLLIAHPSKGYYVAPGAGELHVDMTNPVITVLTPESLSSLDIVPEGFIRGIREKVPLARVSLEFLPQRDVMRFLQLHLTQSDHLGSRGYVLRSVDESVQGFFANHHIPAVVTGYVQPQLNLPVVARDERQITSSVIRFLIGKGHERIAYIEWDGPSGGLEQRMDAYCTTLAETRIASPDETRRYLFKSPLHESETLETFRTIMDLDPRPTALILGNERHAAWILKAVHQWRIRVPRDIALVCLAGGILTDNIFPRLTSVPRNDYEVGAWVGSFLSKLLAGDPLPERQHFMPGYAKEFDTT